MAEAFLDTNVLLRHLLNDHPEFSQKATAILRGVQAGRLAVRTSDTVIFETVFTLERSYRLPRDEIADALLPLIELSGLELPGKTMYHRAFELYLETRIGFADSFHVALMERLGIKEVFSFDTDFDRVPGVLRRER